MTGSLIGGHGGRTSSASAWLSHSKRIFLAAHSSAHQYKLLLHLQVSLLVSCMHEMHLLPGFLATPCSGEKLHLSQGSHTRLA